MTGRWFFSRHGDVVVLRARFEADDGTIGDAHHEIASGDEDFYGLTYEELSDAEAGVRSLTMGRRRASPQTMTPRSRTRTRTRTS